MGTQNQTDLQEEKVQDSNSAVDNQEQKETAKNPEGTHFEHIKETLEILYKNFPKVFSGLGQEGARPLKIGIFEDLKNKIVGIEGLSNSKVRAAMRIYTSRLNYLYSVKEGAKRIDADGNETDEVVSAEHALYAQERIKEIKQKRKPAKTAPKKNFDKKNRGQVKKGQGKFQRKPFKVEGIVATVDNAKQGQEVLVLSSEQHFVRGVLAQDAQKDTVRVTLNSGLTVELPLDRILLPKSAK